MLVCGLLAALALDSTPELLSLVGSARTPSVIAEVKREMMGLEAIQQSRYQRCLQSSVPTGPDR